MNCNRFICGVAMLCLTSIFWSSCQKEPIVKNQTIDEQTDGLKISGVAIDNPSLVGKIPVITSSEFLADTILNYYTYQPLSGMTKGTGNTGRDRTTPTLSFINPLTGSTVSNSVNVQINATDNVGVTAVVFKVNGNIIGTKNVSPYTFTWNTAELASGTHTLTATATDAAGNSKTATIQVGYNTQSGTDITPPTVTINSPTNGASVESTITVGVTATDNIGVGNVTFKVDGVAIANDNLAPYSFSWNTSSVASGVHSLSATAVDAAGNQASTQLQVTVNTTVIPPVSLPTSYQLLMPPVRNQGTEGSCVSFAAVYAARSAEQFYSTNATTYSDATNVFSPEFVFNQVNLGGTCTSSSVVPTLDLMKNSGVCTWQVMPYSTYDGCSLMPSSGQSSNALNYKIAAYSTIIAADNIAIKTMLINKHPVIATINIDQQFYEAKQGFIWNSFTSNSGYHAVTLCGYDDSKRAYKAINSWGANWGDGGYVWIDYDFFPTVSSYYTYSISL